MAAETWRPGGAFDALRLRAALYARIRRFFERRGVLEVETPLLSRAGNTDPNIESFTCGDPAGQGARRWLRTSPEYPLKRLLAAGLGDCYELGRVFRHGEAGRRHNPEFTMLEWYRVGWDHRRLADEVADLVREALALAARPPLRVERVAYRELYRRELGLDPFTAPASALEAALAGHGVRAAGLQRDDWLDLLMTHRLQPGFASDRLLVVLDYPASQCALARVRGSGEDAVAERFEAFLGPQELANGYHELRDPAEQAARFARDLERRRARGQAAPPVDGALLAALDAGLPDCAGVALGIERLLMAMTGDEQIGRVLAFDFSRA